MTSLPASTREEQAALWAARLDGSVLSAADRDALGAWLTADPAHRLLLSSYCQFSADLEQQLPLLAGIRDEVAENQAAFQTASSRPWSRWPKLAGVTLIAAAAVAVVLWLARPQNQFQNLATAVGQRHELTLADGTRIELNARTALAIELTKAERRVRLAGGEAFFSVSHQPDRPFFVETPAGAVRVTGTQFNVRTETADELEVTVREGSVQVRPGDAAPRILHAGDQLVRNPAGLAVQPLAPDALAAALAWREGRLVLHDVPLRDVLARLARYHGRNLTADDAVAGLRVGGVYSLDDLNGFLAALEEVLPVRTTRTLEGAIRVEAARR